MSFYVVVVCLVAAGLLLLAAAVLYLRKRWRVFDTDRKRIEGFLERNSAILEAIKRERQLLNGERENNLALVQIIRYQEAPKVEQPKDLPSGADLDSDAAEKVIASWTKTEQPKQKKRLPNATLAKRSPKSRHRKS